MVNSVNTGSRGVHGVGKLRDDPEIAKTAFLLTWLHVRNPSGA